MRVETVIGSGLRSGQPTPSADAIGQLYVVTDEDIIERWDGDSWVQIAINAASGGGLIAIGLVSSTAGNITCNSTSWIELAAETGGPGTGTWDIVLSGVEAGDIIEVTLGAFLGAGNNYIYLDVATIVSGSPVNQVGFGGASGEGFMSSSYSHEFTATGTACYALQAGDISGGTVRLRPYMRTMTAGNVTLYCRADGGFRFSAKAFRP
jgi:hypothetical protein